MITYILPIDYEENLEQIVTELRDAGLDVALGLEHTGTRAVQCAYVTGNSRDYLSAAVEAQLEQANSPVWYELLDGQLWLYYDADTLPDTEEELVPSDEMPSGYWLRDPNGTYYGRQTNV